MKNGLKLLIMTLPLVMVGVGFVAFTVATKPAPAQEQVAERAIPVRVITATPMSISPVASGFGLIAPARTYAAIPQVTGTAEYVNPMLKKGDILPQGAILLRLSDNDYALAIAQANANIRAAQARLAEITISEQNLKSALEIEQETLEIKASDLQRIERLFTAGTASQAARDGAKAAYLAQSQKLQNLQGSLALLPTQRQVQTEQIAVYQASLETAKLNLARTELRLPFAARVSSVSVEVGQLVRSGQTIASLDGIDAAEVEAQIPASSLQRIFRQSGPNSPGVSVISENLDTLGVTAILRLKLGEQTIEWDATLDRISNAIDPKTGTVGVIIRVEDAYSGARLGTRPPLTKGMFVEAILSAKPVSGIPIPRAALRGKQVMILDSDSRLKLVSVVIDFTQGSVAVISQGIDTGAKIVVSSPVPMMDGVLLAPHDDTALMAEMARLGIAQ